MFPYANKYMQFHSDGSKNESMQNNVVWRCLLETNHFYTVRGYQLLEQSKTSLTPSLEDYMEMICRSIQADGAVRVTALADKLNVKPSSATKMVSKLAELGYLDYERYGAIRMTEKGAALGEYLLWRHETVYRFFGLLTQDNRAEAFIEAEQVEHILSQATVINLEKLLHFLTAHEAFLNELQAFLAADNPV